MTAAPPVRTVAKPDLEPLAAALARAFDDDPVWTWAVPNDEKRPVQLGRIFKATLAEGVARGDTVLSAGDGAATVLWRPPGRWETGPLENVRFALPFLRLGRTSWRRLFHLGNQIVRRHPREDHWYLTLIGTDPPAQRRGLASSLMAGILDRCDNEGLPAFLETETEENVAFYHHHGFAVRDELDVPGGGPHMWFMYRTPRGDL